MTITTHRATRREWIGLAVLALPCILYAMDLTVLYLAVPSLARELQPDPAQMLWIIDIYGFLVAGLLVSMGTLGDRIGRRRLLLTGAAAFGVASALASLANTAGQLIAARALMGIAAATLAPSTLSLIRCMFEDEHQRRVAIGVWVASFSAGGALGPVFGGMLLEHFHWGAVFLVNVPVMALLLLAGPRLLPEYRDPAAGRIDIASALLATLAVLGVVYGIKHVAARGDALPALAAIAGGVTCGVLFARRQRGRADPFIDPALFRIPAFSAALAINLLSLFVAMGFFLFVAQYLQLVLGMGPLEAGLWTAPSGVLFAAGSLVAPQLVRRWRVSTVIAGSLALTAAGFLLLAQAMPPFWLLMTGFLAMCAGLAPLGTLSTDLVLGSAPPERAGAASAISETSFELGGALGIAVMGSLVNALYLAAMSPGLPDTLAGALAQAGQLPPTEAAALMATARGAYADAMATAALLGAVLSLVAAAAAATLLRGR